MNWKIISVAPDYMVSDHGDIKSLPRTAPVKNGFYRIVRERILKQHMDSLKKYMTVVLRIDNKPKTFFVHRLVAEAFVPNPTKENTVNHKNRNGLDNRVQNIEWCSIRENASHGQLGRKKSSKYIGVTKAYKGQWRSSIRINGRRIVLGQRFKTEKEAHQAYQKALVEYGIENKYAKVV